MNNNNHWFKHNTIEWFFDLVFVWLFIQLNNFLINNFSFFNFYVYSIVLLGIYWIWIWYTVYHERLYHMLDNFEKKTIFLKIIVLWFIWVAIPWITLDTTTGFIVLFILARLLLLMLRHRVYKTQKKFKPLAKEYIYGYSIWIWFLVLSFFWENLIQQVILWTCAIFVDIFTSMIAEKRRKNHQNLYTHHYFERFSLLTLIALWETIIIILKYSYNLDLTEATNILWTLVLFYIIYWIYRKYFEEFYEAKMTYDIQKIHAYNYLHFIIIYSILLVSVWFSLIINESNLNYLWYNIALVNIWLTLYIFIIRILENFLWYKRLSIQRIFILVLMFITSLLIYTLQINSLAIVILIIILWFEIFIKTKRKN